MNTSLTLLSASDMFGVEEIERKGICTLDNGAKFEAMFKIRPQSGGVFHDELEKELVREFNASQPHMVHKLVRIHLMRN